MDMKKFVIVCGLFLGMFSVGAYGANPGEIPALPQVPPPKIKYIERPSALDNVLRINESYGWQIVTFAVEQVEAVWGLERMLYRLEGDKYILVDPVNSPQSLEPGVAYITYFDKPHTIYYRPKNSASASLKTSLKDGWNLLSYPGEETSKNTVTFTNADGQNATIADLKNGSAHWIGRDTYIFNNGNWKKSSILPGEDSYPGEIMTVFAYEKLTINWNLDLPCGEITKEPEEDIGRDERSEWDELLEVDIAQANSNLGTMQKLADEPTSIEGVDFAEIQAQQDEISRKLLEAEKAQTQRNQLMVNRQLEAARMRSAVAEERQRQNLVDYVLGSSGNTGELTLSGVVTDNRSRPLDYAKVKLSNGRMTHTDRSGRFCLENLSAGSGYVTISKPGYKTGSGKIDLTSGKSKEIRVSLSPNPKTSTSYDKDVVQKGNFYVKAYPLRVGPKERRIYVSKIEVWEDGNYSHRWEKTWWEDYHDDYYELRCDEAEIGKIYNIVITWKSHRPGDSGRSDKWTKRFNSRDETFSFDHP